MSYSKPTRDDFSFLKSLHSVACCRQALPPLLAPPVWFYLSPAQRNTQIHPTNMLQSSLALHARGARFPFPGKRTLFSTSLCHHHWKVDEDRRAANEGFHDRRRRAKAKARLFTCWRAYSSPLEASTRAKPMGRKSCFLYLASHQASWCSWALHRLALITHLLAPPCCGPVPTAGCGSRAWHTTPRLLGQPWDVLPSASVHRFDFHHWKLLLTICSRLCGYRTPVGVMLFSFTLAWNKWRSLDRKSQTLSKGSGISIAWFPLTNPRITLLLNTCRVSASTVKILSAI